MFSRDRLIFSTDPNIDYQRFEPPFILGEGTFSKVEKVRNQIGNYVAIKIIRMKDNNLRNFLPEILSRRLGRNPFCVYPQNVSCYRIDGSTDIRVVLEYEMYDSDLFKFVDKYRGSRESLIANILIFYQYLTQGIYFLLDNGIYHADIKPENILCKMIQEDGQIYAQVRFSDFGLSSQTPCLIPQETDYRIDFGGGTPIYEPPEQFRKHILMGTSMFYSLAMTVFWCLGDDIQKMIDNSKLPRERRARFSFSKIYRFCTPPQIRTLTAIETILNAVPSTRRIYLPIRNPNQSYTIEYRPLYASKEEIYEKIQPYFAEQSLSQALRNFLFQIYFLVTEVSPYPLGIVQYIGVIDCVSRYLKKFAYQPLIIELIIALYRTEIYHCPLFSPRYDGSLILDALLMIHSLDYRLFDCHLSSGFFCFQNEPKLTPENFADLDSNFPEVFSNPPRNFTQILTRIKPELLLDCQEPIAFEHLRPNPDRYLQVDS